MRIADRELHQTLTSNYTTARHRTVRNVGPPELQYADSILQEWAIEGAFAKDRAERRVAFDSTTGRRMRPTRENAARQGSQTSAERTASGGRAGLPVSPGGLPEAIIDPVKPGAYTTHPVF